MRRRTDFADNQPRHQTLNQKQYAVMTEPMVEDPPRSNGDTDSGAGATPGIDLLGVTVHRVDMRTALDIIRGYVRSGRPHIVVTADASGIVIAQEDEEYRRIVNTADLVTPDGAGILKGAAMLGAPLIERVSGVDLAREICRMSAEDGFGVFFLGAAPEVAQEAADRLREMFPEMRVAGVHHGYFGPEQDAEVAAMVRDSGAKALLVAMGIPRQEKWIRRHLDELGVSVAMGVGGTFDVFSGRVRRAPEWMQRHGLEWAYRLVRNPRKISKVATLPRFAALVLKRKYLGRGSGR